MKKTEFIHRFQCGTIAHMKITTHDGQPVDWRCDWSHEMTSARIDGLIDEDRIWRDASLRCALGNPVGLKILFIET